MRKDETFNFYTHNRAYQALSVKQTGSLPQAGLTPSRRYTRVRKSLSRPISYRKCIRYRTYSAEVTLLCKQSPVSSHTCALRRPKDNNKKGAACQQLFLVFSGFEQNNFLSRDSVHDLPVKALVCVDEYRRVHAQSNAVVAFLEIFSGGLGLSISPSVYCPSSR